MVERTKDKDELRLEALFRSEEVADDGFSRHVMRRVRRQIWIRRLALPTALVAGGMIAFRPASDLFLAAVKLVDVLPSDLTGSLPTAAMLPQATTVMVGVALVAIALLFIPALED